MVNVKNCILGTITFFAGYFLVLILQYISPALLNILDDDFSTTAGVVWFGLLIIYFLLMVIIPVAFFVSGIMETQHNNPVLSGTFGILWMIFSLGLFFLSWYTVTPFTSVLVDGYTIGLFYAGIIMVWIFNVIVIPYFFITKAKGG